MLLVLLIGSRLSHDFGTYQHDSSTKQGPASGRACVRVSSHGRADWLKKGERGHMASGRSRRRVKPGQLLDVHVSGRATRWVSRMPKLRRDVLSLQPFGAPEASRVPKPEGDVLFPQPFGTPGASRVPKPRGDILSHQPFGTTPAAIQHGRVARPDEGPSSDPVGCTRASARPEVTASTSLLSANQHGRVAHPNRCTSRSHPARPRSPPRPMHFQKPEPS